MKLVTVLLILMALCTCSLKCTNKYGKSNDSRGPQYAGTAACMQCHKDITTNFAHTGHFRTSSPVDFNKFKQLITTINDTVHFSGDQFVSIEARNQKLVQAYFSNSKEIKAEPMHIAFGSGEKAWTFGYWKDDQLYQLPLTYLSAMKIWTNSPGFPMKEPYFTRPIVGRCMECHTSFTNVETEVQGMQYTEKLQANSIIYGIDCERCHGPAAEHVQFQIDHPKETTAKFITPIKSLSRQQKLDMCATCHSGDPAKLKSIFAFLPGDTLSGYYLYSPMAGTSPDAHGMQMQSVMQSKCFQQSDLTCMSCHDSHTNEFNKQDLFVQRCMACHQQSKHATLMQQNKNYCINCHMPLEASKSLDFNNSAEQSNLKYSLRTHRIAIYEMLNNKK